MTDRIGYVVLARTPDGTVDLVKMRDGTNMAVFPGTSKGLEQAQNVLESCERRGHNPIYDASGQRWTTAESVEYVIGEIRNTP